MASERRSPRVAVLAALAAAIAAAPSWSVGTELADAAPGWRPPLAVEATPSAAALSFPRIAARPAGCSTVVFERSAGVYASTRPAGGAYSPLQALGAIAPSEYPDIATGGGRAAAAWTASPTDVRIATAAGCDPLGAAVEVPGAYSFASDAVVAVDGAGTAMTAFQAGGTGSRAIHVSERPADGSPSSAVEIELSPGLEGFRPQLAAGAAGAALAFDVVDGGSQVYGSRRTGPGAWSAPVRLTAAGKSAVAGSARAALGPDGSLYVAWIDSGGKEVVFASLDPSGAVARTTLITANSVREPAIAADAQGRLVVLWADQAPGGQARIYGKYREPGSATFSPQRDVSPATGEFRGNPHVAIDPQGRTIATWSAVATSGATQRVFAATRASGGSFFLSNPTPLSIASQYTAPSDISTDAEGNTLVALYVTDTPREAEVAAFDAAPPLVGGVSIPVAGTVGQALPFTVSALDAWSPPVAARWDFGDGASTSGEAVSHAYAAAGAFPVQVSVADALANAAALAGTTAVAAVPPPAGTDAGPGGGRGPEGGAERGGEGPRLLRLAVSPRRLLLGTRRPCLTVRLRLSAPARVRLLLQRRKGGAWLTVRRARRSFAAGSHAHCLRARPQALPAGRYRLRAIAIGPGGEPAGSRSAPLAIARG